MSNGLRERKKRQTRAALIRAALELCETKGVEAVTVADIADAADVSRRTFFNYFATREEAILGSGADRSERLVACLNERPAGEPAWEALRAAFATFLSETDEPQREWMARARLVRANPSLLDQQRADFAEMEQRLVAGIVGRTGEDLGALEPRLLVGAAVTTVRVAVNHWIDTPSDIALADAIDHALARMAAGCGALATPIRNP